MREVGQCRPVDFSVYQLKAEFVLEFSSAELARMANGWLTSQSRTQRISVADIRLLVAQRQIRPSRVQDGKPQSFDAPTLLADIERGAVDRWIETLIRLEAESQFERDIRAEAERLRRRAIEDAAKKRAGTIGNLLEKSEFRIDLQRAVAAVIRDHYSRIPSMVAEIVSKELADEIPLQEAVRCYGLKFTGAVLDRLADSWVKRTLANTCSQPDTAVIQQALKLVGAIQQGRMSVYFLKPTGLRVVKVGIADDLPSRVTGVQTGCPFPLTCVLSFPGGCKVEGAIHKAFRRTRLMGEWFVIDGTMRAFIVQARAKLNRLFALSSEPKKAEKLGRHLAYINKRASRDTLWLANWVSDADAEKMTRELNELLEGEASA